MSSRMRLRHCSSCTIRRSCAASNSLCSVMAAVCWRTRLLNIQTHTLTSSTSRHITASSRTRLPTVTHGAPATMTISSGERSRDIKGGPAIKWARRIHEANTCHTNPRSRRYSHGFNSGNGSRAFLTLDVCRSPRRGCRSLQVRIHRVLHRALRPLQWH